MKHKHGAWIAALLLAVSVTACEVPEDDSETAADRSEVNNTKTEDKAADKKDKGKSDAPKETAGQENARASAESYLDMSAFSRDGLIKQLKFEGFSQKDAEYGVDAQKANWNKQAAASAEAYLDMSSFSGDGLIQQLKFEGFTQKQAKYGVNQVGL